MHAFLHTVGAVVVVPYVALALFFLFIGQVARAKGLKALIDIVWNNVDWHVGWGIYAAPVLWVCLVATGFVPHLQRASSLCLCILAVASFLVVVTLSSTRAGVGELIFLLPCVAVAATSAWLFFRVVAS
jgi:hypothetical protein